MTFLQPYVLWGLPLVLLPVLIHLLNRLRHRPQAWAAMRFLVSATRSSVSNARLKQWLVLLCRVLAVLMLVFFLSRPLAGGWLGWVLSPAPDVVLILLDRSASMETRIPGTELSKREQALDDLAQAAKPFEETTRFVLIDSALRTPQEIGRIASLNGLPLCAPTDTTADIPGLLSSGLNWLLENHPGTAEIWLASDLQKSNWHPDDSRWPGLMAQFNALPQKIRIRLLALDQSAEVNRSVALKELQRRSHGLQKELRFALDLLSTKPSSDSLPLVVNLNGTRTTREIVMEGQSLRWRNQLSLANAPETGWGSFELPADANGRDNRAYFIYSNEAALHASIFASNSLTARLLDLAIGAGATKPGSRATSYPLTGAARSAWDSESLIAWQGLLPVGAVAQRLRAFAEQGGTILFLPPGQSDPERFEGLGWGDLQSAEGNQSFRILRWNEDDGPLAKSDEGLSLPLRDSLFLRRQIITGQKSVLAAFDDGTPFLASQTLGRGQIYFCASLPERDWSSLGEGPVLVPMMQRLLESGAARLRRSAHVECGELSRAEQGEHWESLDGSNKDIRIEAGVYRAVDRVLAVNRPVLEDDPDRIESSQAERLFAPLSVRTFQERKRVGESLQGEVWRLFLVSMLLLLIAEAWLILPPRSEMAAELASKKVTPREREVRV